MDLTARSRWRRLAGAAALVALVAIGGLLVGLPKIVSGPVARRILTARAGRILSPGGLQASSVRLSWFGPTEIDEPVLLDGRGARLIVAQRATVDWSLWHVLFQQPDSLTLELPGAALDIERLPNGQIDLYETLEPIIREEPELRLVVEIPAGRLRFHGAGLAEPIVADQADIRLEIPPAPRAVIWNVALRRDATGEPDTVAFKGSVHRPGQGDASVSLDVSHWPFAVLTAGNPVKGALSAKFSAERQDMRWRISGDATASGLEAGESGDGAVVRAGPERIVTADWEIEGQGRDWTARHLGLSVPYARLEGWGILQSALDGGGMHLDLKGSLAPDWDAIQADLRREVEPAARLAGRPRDWRISGMIGAADSPDRLAGLTGEMGIQLDALDVFGMRLSKTAVVLRTKGERIKIDPIDARLNEGVLHLEPELVRSDDGSMRLRFGPASTLKDAAVNDEVSHRVLSYAAPILDGATRVAGRVSVQNLDAEFPLARDAGKLARVSGDVLFDDVRFLPGPLAEAIIDLLPDRGLDDAGNGPMLALRDPISFRIADRKVHTEGLVLPLGQIGTAGLEGSVDFDRRLDLLARFRLNPPRMDRPVLAALLNNARFELPITGTFDDPRIDEKALKRRLESLGQDMLGNSIAAGAGGLLRLLDGLPRRREARKPAAPAASPEAEPAEPQAAPRPSALERQRIREERRQERLEKKAQRRMQRGQPPE